MATMQAVVIDPQAAAHLSLQEIKQPAPLPSEAVVRVSAISLNLGEVRMAQSRPAGTQIGWDLAGTVEQQAADGSGPPVGTRVVAFVPTGAWSELVAVPTHALAVLPDSVSFAQAATLPVAGLTALHSVERATGLLGRKVLVTGASGGCGHFAIQLAALAGAGVVALIRQARHQELVRAAGASSVVVSEDGAEARAEGPYRLVVESVGGKVLSNALGMLGPDGVCVSFGGSAGADVHFNLWSLVSAGRASWYGLVLQNELVREPASIGLTRLGHLVGAGRVRPHIAVEASWRDIGGVATDLLERRIAGKAVLHLD